MAYYSRHLILGAPCWLFAGLLITRQYQQRAKEEKYQWPEGREDNRTTRLDRLVTLHVPDPREGAKLAGQARLCPSRPSEKPQRGPEEARRGTPADQRATGRATDRKEASVGYLRAGKNTPGR